MSGRAARANGRIRTQVISPQFNGAAMNLLLSFALHECSDHPSKQINGS
jgi:hypothetical protein